MFDFDFVKRLWSDPIICGAFHGGAFLAFEAIYMAADGNGNWWVAALLALLCAGVIARKEGQD